HELESIDSFDFSEFARSVVLRADYVTRPGAISSHFPSRCCSTLDLRVRRFASRCKRVRQGYLQANRSLRRNDRVESLLRPPPADSSTYPNPRPSPWASRSSTIEGDASRPPTN